MLNKPYAVIIASRGMPQHGYAHHLNYFFPNPKVKMSKITSLLYLCTHYDSVGQALFDHSEQHTSSTRIRTTIHQSLAVILITLVTTALTLFFKQQSQANFLKTLSLKKMMAYIQSFFCKCRNNVFLISNQYQHQYDFENYLIWLRNSFSAPSFFYIYLMCLASWHLAC